MSDIGSEDIALPVEGIPNDIFFRASQLIDWRVPGILWGLTFLLFIADALWLAISPMDLLTSSMFEPLALFLVLVIIAVTYIFLRPEPHVAVVTVTLAQVALFNILGAILSYLVTSLGRPYADDIFARCDEWLGFNWTYYATFLRSNVWINQILAMIYHDSFLQILILVPILGVTRRFDALYRLLGNISLGLVVTNVIAAFLPAVGAYAHYGKPDLGLSNFTTTIRAVHDGALRVFDFNAIHGLLTFPSYHAILSIALILTTLHIRYLRYPVLALNMLVLISTPAFGEHYLTDVIVGSSLTLVLDCLWRRVMRYESARTSLANWSGIQARKALMRRIPISSARLTKK